MKAAADNVNKWYSLCSCFWNVIVTTYL